MLTEAQKRYNASDKAKATRRRYVLSPKGKASWKKYNESNKKKAARTRYALKRKYGLSPEDVQNLAKIQNNLCGVCQRPFEKTPHVDHDHTTGKIRGLLCGSCNRIEGLIRGTGLNPTSFSVALSNYLTKVRQESKL